ncbi:hypothetical protein [Deinococcus altitudinis]|uniref:hypothetical protein n=1 Tax=Deinococcus altitudinis TaxID=468914 RepID=UPI003891A2F6
MLTESISPAGFSQMATEVAMQRAELSMLKGMSRSDAIEKAMRLYEFLMWSAGCSPEIINDSTTRSVFEEFLADG